MNRKERYKMRIDELNEMILTAFGYTFGDFDKKKLRTPDEWDDFDMLLIDGKGFDMLKTTPKSVKKTETEQTVTVLSPEKRRKFEDDFLEYLIYAYTDGIEAVNEMLTSDAETTSDGIYLAINKKTAGKTYKERLNEHLDNGDVLGLIRLGDTEFHRIFNEAIVDGGAQAGAKYKTWQTMADDRVRDAHWELEGVKIPYGDKFHVDGAEAFAPAGFGVPELDINCRCYLELS